MQIGEEDENFKVRLRFERGPEIARKLRSDPPFLIVGIVSTVVEANCTVGHAIAAEDGLDVATTIRTARRMGIRAVAVYSDADADLPYVREADQAVRIGPAQPAKSYLDAAAIIEAAARTGAQAVHPGDTGAAVVPVADLDKIVSGLKAIVGIK